MEYLVSFRDRMEHARVLLTDPKLTAFCFVTLAEALPTAVVADFVKNRVAMQEGAKPAAGNAALVHVSKGATS